MKPKIVIADDGLTIQKVIKITLANENYELIECLSEADLHKTISEHQPNLVLLDFNLSENKTGYDLAKEIKEISSTKIIMMYGTYDNINEDLFEEAGINSHIVKPFDGAKFINLCRNMVSDSQLDQPGPIEDEMSIDDGWVVNQPDVIEEEEEISTENVVTSEEMNHLEQGMQDWGIDVPGVIGDASDTELTDLPPVISSEAETEVDITLPSDDDLEYPSDSGPKSKLISIDDLQEGSEVNFTKEISLDDTKGTKTEEEIQQIEALIADEDDEEYEVEDSAAEADLWAVDDVSEEDNVVDESLEQAGAEEDFDKPQLDDIEIELETNTAIDEPAASSELSLAPDELEEKIRAIIAPMVEKIMREEIERAVDKVAWEVIPDLAENLIKKELKSVTDAVMGSTTE